MTRIGNSWFDLWGVPLEIGRKYEAYLGRHIEAVREAGPKLGVPTEQLNVHDASKWEGEEFYGYAMHFFGGGAPDDFANAWLHHIHHNPHHWEHWIFPADFTMKGVNIERNCLQMPDEYVLEMVADWQGAGYAITGSWDITNWLDKNLGRVRLHSKSMAYLEKVLKKIGYLHESDFLCFYDNKLTKGSYCSVVAIE